MNSSKGKDLEVRIAKSEAGLVTAPPIPYILHVEYDPGQNFGHSPLGMGFGRKQEVVDGLLSPKGVITRKYDATAVIGADVFWNAVESTNQGEVSASYVEIKNTVTRRKAVIRGAKGNCPVNADLEGFVMETWTFLAEEISESAY